MTTDFLLLENGFRFLQENGFGILREDSGTLSHIFTDIKNLIALNQQDFDEMKSNGISLLELLEFTGTLNQQEFETNKLNAISALELLDFAEFNALQHQQFKTFSLISTSSTIDTLPKLYKTLNQQEIRIIRAFGTNSNKNNITKSSLTLGSLEILK